MADSTNCVSETKINSENVELNVSNHGDGSSELSSSLLLIVGEPFNVEQKDLILERIVTELSSWDAGTSKCDINQELSNVGPFKSNSQEGEKIFEHKTPKIDVVVLVNPTLRTTSERISSFVSVPSSYKYLLYSGPTLLNSGSWLLQDGPFTCNDVCDAFRKGRVAESSAEVLLDVGLVTDSSEWNEMALQKSCGKLKVRLSRPSKVLTDETGLIKFSDNLSTFLKTSVVSDRLKSTEVQGTITFDKPTCYVFPAGLGNSLLFGISGFTFLIDGGYSRNACFWDFLRHLAKLDGMLISRLSHDNVFGLSSFFEKKSVDKSGPEVGMVFLNIGDARHKHPVNGSPSRATSGLLVSIAEEGRLLAEHLSLINLTPPMPCLASQNHVSLYYKVGHGSLDMFVLNPVQDSKELKDFLVSWSRSVDTYKGGVPLSDAVSVACLLVWKPSPHLKENIVRIMCPGRIAQQKLLDGLDKLKNLICFHSKSGSEKAIIKKPQVSSTPGNKGTAVPASARPATTKSAVGTKQEGKKTSSATSLEHKVNDVKKPAETKKASMTPKESTKRPPALGHGRTTRLAASPQKSPTKTTKSTASTEPKSIKGGMEKKVEPKSDAPAIQATSSKEKIPDAVKVEVLEGEGQLSAKESKEEAKEIEDVSSTAATPSSNEEVKSNIAGEKEGGADEIFEPEKEWGVPAGLPSPMKNPDEPSDQQPIKKPAATDAQKSPDKTKKIGMGPGGDKATGHRIPAADKTSGAGKEDPSKALSNAIKKSKGAGDAATIAKTTISNKPDAKKPLKPVQGFYVDLTYIPNNADIEFFRRVRAQFYILSSPNPDVSILVNLLDAKATWEKTDQWEVSVVPTQESPALSQWLQQNAERLSDANVKVTPPASICTIQLEDRQSACAAYRLQL